MSMLTTTLPTTDLSISRICLGTMGYGFQVSEADAHAQLEYALSTGVNFWDTAEMYPVPPTPERYGHTEEIIGRWFTKTGRRKDVVLASKIAGPNRYTHLRGGTHTFSADNILTAIDESLKRLQTDYIDLYQLHWPERNVPMFGVRGYRHIPEETITQMLDTLRGLATAVQQGKIRAIGLSNETPWGTIEFLRLAAQDQGLPVMATVQNAYNLLNRHYEIGMAEVSMRENIPLLAYSPLGYGVLGGRYLGGAVPKGGRFDMHPDFAVRYHFPHVAAVTQEYADLAKTFGMSLATMSLAFVRMQPFVLSTIIGASTLDQLTEDIASINTTLSDEQLAAIDAIHERHPNLVA